QTGRAWKRRVPRPDVLRRRRGSAGARAWKCLARTRWRRGRCVAGGGRQRGCPGVEVPGADTLVPGAGRGWRRPAAWAPAAQRGLVAGCGGPPPDAEVTVAEELIAFASKGDMLAKSKEFWNPGKTQFWVDSGVPLVIDRREGYFIYDVEGKRLIDTHLN